MRTHLLAFAVVALGVCAPLQAQVTRTFTEPYEEIELSAAETGIIQSIPVREGQRVKANDLVGSLDTRVLEESKRLASLRAKSTAKAEAAQADLKIKRRLYENLSQLLRSGQANPNEVEKAESEYRQAEAAWRLATEESIESKIEVDRINAQIAQREIRSPIDGVVLVLHRKKGEYVSGSKPEFATIVQLSKLRARFFITTAQAETLKTGSKVNAVVGRKRKPVLATVEFVSPVTDAQSGTVRMDVAIDNRRGELRSGVLCELLAADSLSKPRGTATLTPPPKQKSATQRSVVLPAPNRARR